MTNRGGGGNRGANVAKWRFRASGGRFAEAAKLYRRSSKGIRGKESADSLGLIEAAAGNLTERREIVARSVSVQAANVPVMQTTPQLLCQLGQFETAGTVCRKGLELAADKTSTSLCRC